MLKMVTLKGTFLLAVASAKRVGKLHGLSDNASHSEGWISRHFVPEFIAKTQNSFIQDSLLSGVSIPSR